MWKSTGDTNVLHMCTINEDQIKYDSWEIKAQRTEFFVILEHFLPFDPLYKPKKIKILQK